MVEAAKPQCSCYESMRHCDSSGSCAAAAVEECSLKLDGVVVVVVGRSRMVFG